MDATRRGDDRRQEGVTQAVGRVALPIFINLRPSPLREREIKVLMAQGAIQRGVVSAAMEVVNCGDVYCDPPKISNVHVAGEHVCHIVLVQRALIPGDILGVGVESSLAEEGHETLQDVVVAPGPGGLVMTAGEDVIPVDIVAPLAGATPIVGSQSTHGWQRQPQVHTEPALPFAGSEAHDPVNVGET